MNLPSWIIVAAASEIIALTPLKSNSVINWCSRQSMHEARKDLNIPADGKWTGVSTHNSDVERYNAGYKRRSLQLFHTRFKESGGITLHKDAQEAEWEFWEKSTDNPVDPCHRWYLLIHTKETKIIKVKRLLTTTLAWVLLKTGKNLCF